MIIRLHSHLFATQCRASLRRSFFVPWRVLLAGSLLALGWLGQAGDDEHLPKVLIIGDSISIGYTKPLKTLLKGRAVVMHHPGNAQHSGHGLQHLDQWLGEVSWDVIHFNHGLHDLKYVDAHGKNVRSKDKGHIQIGLAQYGANMEAIVKRLSRTGAALVFATTTPYPDHPAGPLREAWQAERYNAVALEVMQKYQIPVNDLYTFALPQLKTLQQPENVHFTREGSRALAGEVCKSILKALGNP